MKVLFELWSEAERGFDHRSLGEILRERERKATDFTFTSTKIRLTIRQLQNE